MENKPSISLGTLLLGLLLTSIIFLTYYFFPVIKSNYERLITSRQQSPEIPAETPVPTPTRNPNYKLPTGPQSYTFSHGDNVVGPRVTTISFSPLAAEKDNFQSVSAVFPAGEKVSAVVFSYDTDNQKNQKLELKPKTDNPSIWEARWVFPDTVQNKYLVRLYFVGEKGTYNEVMKILE